MLDTLVGRIVVIDLQSHYVCLGRLDRFDDHWLELRHADVHDLRDINVSRENYIASACSTGIKRNRKKVLLRRGDIVAIAAIEDVVDE